MYYVPNSHPYYPNAHASMYYPDERSNEFRTLSDDLIKTLQKEALAIELYRQLSYLAPNEEHKNHILQVLERKQTQLYHLTDMYIHLTGAQPEYELELVPIGHYREGLQKAYETELHLFDEFQHQSYLIRHPQVKQMFLWVEQDNAEIIRFLYEEMSRQEHMDHGGNPFVIDIEEATTQNQTFRSAIWTGRHLQVTLMSIPAGEDIGLEIHMDTDQFLRIEDGEGIVQMGDNRDALDFQQRVSDDFAIMIPAGKWHNVTNTGDKPLKLYSIYAPPEHPLGTVHATKAEAMAAEHEHRF